MILDCQFDVDRNVIKTRIWRFGLRLSPRPKHLAHQALDHERFQAEALFLHFVVELLDEEVVMEFHGAAGGVGEELADEVAGEMIGAGVVDDFFEAGEVGVSLAGGEFAGGVDLWAVFGFFRLRVGAAPVADGIEGFQAEAERGDFAMALGAGGVRPPPRSMSRANSTRPPQKQFPSS